MPSAAKAAKHDQKCDRVGPKVGKAEEKQKRQHADKRDSDQPLVRSAARGTRRISIAQVNEWLGHRTEGTMAKGQKQALPNATIRPAQTTALRRASASTRLSKCRQKLLDRTIKGALSVSHACA
jgi:hypothetical protein